MNDIQKRKIFQRVKALSKDQFWSWMNWLHSKAYAAAVRHYSEAAEIVLTPKQRAALHAKAQEIRETWDGIQTVTIDDTEAEDMDKVLRRGSDGTKDR